MNLIADRANGGTRVRSAILWSLCGLAAPVTIVLHELGHFVTGRVLGHPNVVLHYGSVTSDAARAGSPLAERAAVAAAGPLVTCAIVALCCYWAARAGAPLRRPAIVTGLFAPIKFSVGAVFLYYWFSGVRNSSPNFDEYNVARLLGISPMIPIVAGLLILVGSWIFLLRCVKRGERLLAITCASAGAVAGMMLYALGIGPWLLP